MGRRMQRIAYPRVVVQPTVMIIGAQKGGTTSLALYLQQHPEVSRAASKEIDFFGSTPRYDEGLEFYHRHFLCDVQDAGKMTFDASPHYLFCPHAAGRIRAYNPDSRIICLLREPISRAFSAFQMYRRLLAENPCHLREWNRRCYTVSEQANFLPRPRDHLDDFTLAVTEEIEAFRRGFLYEWHLLQYGLYAAHLQSFYRSFPRNQILILDSSRFEKERANVMATVTEFLGLGRFDWAETVQQRHHEGSYSQPIPEAAREILVDFYREPNRRLLTQYGLKLSWMAEAQE